MAQRISQAIEEGKIKMDFAGKSEHRVDVEWLMCEVTGLSRTMLSIEGQGLLSDQAYNEYCRMLDQRLDGMPLQYILGEQSFYGYDFYVNEHVLIPRFETEELVELAVKWAKDNKALRLIDMCTGSGCIGLTMLKECASMTGVLVDLSPKALELADRNRIRLNLNDRATLIQSDLFEDVEPEIVDIITANPPYIETKDIEGLSVEVKSAEPTMALDGGEDGLIFYRKITHEAKAYLREGGLLIYEIGHNQMAAVKEIFKNEGYSHIEGIQDLSGHDRIVLAMR